MSTRKSKPDFPSEIELLDKRLQLATVTVEQKTPARGSQSRRPADLHVIEIEALPRRKVTLH
jgi:hypothetical protein